LKKYEELGYEVIEYRGFFGHHGYYNRLPFLKRIHELKTDYLLRKPSPLFTSYAYVVLKKAQKHLGEGQCSPLSPVQQQCRKDLLLPAS
jgi:hypothetical protein